PEARTGIRSVRTVEGHDANDELGLGGERRRGDRVEHDRDRGAGEAVVACGACFYPRISSTETVTLGSCSGVSMSPRDADRVLAYFPATGFRYTSIRSSGRSTSQASGIPARA